MAMLRQLHKMKGEKKQKRVLIAPYKKWKEREVQALITFLKEYRPIEKPTAQIYYRKYLEENEVVSEWKHVRCKVKHMRVSYNNAKAMLNSTEAFVMAEGETIQSIVLKKCPLFYDYEEIFGSTDDVLSVAISDSESAESPGTWSQQEMQSLKYSNVPTPIDMHTSSDVCKAEPEEILEFSSQQIPAVPNNSKKTLQKGIYSRTGLSDVLQIQSEILSQMISNKETELQLKETELALQNEKLLFDKEKYANELDLQREKFAFEKQKQELESKRMEHQLQTERELRIMEINMKKEIAIREIEMKERVEMEKLKK